MKKKYTRREKHGRMIKSWHNHFIANYLLNLLKIILYYTLMTPFYFFFYMGCLFAVIVSALYSFGVKLNFNRFLRKDHFYVLFHPIKNKKLIKSTYENFKQTKAGK